MSQRKRARARGLNPTAPFKVASAHACPSNYEDSEKDSADNPSGSSTLPPESNLRNDSECDERPEWKKLCNDLLKALHSPSLKKDGSFASCKGAKDSEGLLFQREVVEEAERALQPWLNDVMNGKWDIYSPKIAIPLSYIYGKDELFFDEVQWDDRIILEVLRACKDENGKQLLNLHLCLVRIFMCGDILLRSSSSSSSSSGHSDDNETGGQQLRVPRLEIGSSSFVKESVRDILGVSGLDESSEYDTTSCPSPPCDRHDGEGEEHVCHAHDWTTVSPGSGFHRDLHAPVSDQEEDKIMFWTGEEDNKLNMAFGRLGLEKREVVVGEREYSEQDDREDIRHHPIHPECKRWWYKALVILWPRDLSLSILCETNLYGIGIINRKAAKEVAAMIKVYGPTMWSSLILKLVNKWALLQGRSFVGLAEELFLIDSTDAGTIVAKTIIEVFGARITELEQRTKPRFTWCQPQAKFPDSSMIENFLKGPEQRLVVSDMEDESEASCLRQCLVDTNNPCIVNRIYENGRYMVEVCKTTHHFKITTERWEKEVQDQLLTVRTELTVIKAALKRAEAGGVNTIPTVASQHAVQKEGEFSETNLLETFL